jgi:ribokinase
MSGMVAVVGSFNVDHVWTPDTLPVPGETRSGRYAAGAGGKGFNQAVASARAGASTRFVCALGDDAGGALARELAARDGIALHAAPATEPTGAAGIFVDATGRNSIVVAAGANAALDAGFVAGHAALLRGAAVVVAQLESPVDAVQEALRIARAGGARTVLNPAPADADMTPALLALADILTPNETEFAALLQRHASDLAIAADVVATHDDVVLHGLCRHLLPAGTVVITLGAAGCFVSHPAPRWGDATTSYRVPASSARVVDTTGAGDAFNGALAASLVVAPQAAFAVHVRFASRYAALSTEAPGAAVSMPRRADVVARFGPEHAAP